MTSGDEGSTPALRLWWAVPLGLAVVTAVVFIAVVLPALAGGPAVPSQLVVHRSPVPAASTPATSSPTSSPTPPTTPTSAAPQPTRSTTVVPPEQPVVRESGDRYEDRGGSGSGEPNDR